MPTRDVFCRESLEEQIRKHAATMTTAIDLFHIEENSKPSEIVESVDLCQLRNDEIEPTNSKWCDEIKPKHGDDIDGNLQSSIFIPHRGTAVPP
ncbi:hypothetical protein ACH3XW_19570 [Acanthocheilonema viteae]